MKKSISKQNILDRISPFYLLIGLYCIVGFLTVINQQFQIPIQDALLAQTGAFKNTLTTLIVFAFFLGFPSASNWSGKLINRRGYKFTLITGLAILIGALVLFVLSAKLTPLLGKINLSEEAFIPSSYIVFLLASMVLGVAMAFLHVVINPYLSNSDVPHTTSASRITMGSTSNSIGTFLAPLFLSYFIFNANKTISINQVVVPFALMALGLFLLTVLVSKMNLPCIEGTKCDDNKGESKRVWSYRNLKFGVVAIFLYIGAEVAIGANISLYAQALNVEKFTTILNIKKLGLFFKMETIPLMISLYWGSILLVRLFASRLFKYIDESRQLLLVSIIAALFILLAVLFNKVWLLVCVGFGHSIMWPLIFNLSIKNLGQYTSLASGKLMIGMLGGALIPWTQGVLADVFGWQYTWLLIIACELYLIWFAINGSKVKQQ
jgi:FHS family L-fucose permease-like MFS transporter